LRLGEASGAATALLLLRAALACHTGMATFAQAGVSDKPAGEAAEPKAAG
jgi:nicotinate-nucleotide--dimethylbenzimidazole phosphoribosyltransferase